MAKWSPPNKVGLQELIGRRLFEDSKLKGAEGQPPFNGIQLNYFLEKRDREVSLDRLGRSNIENPVKKYLIPRASNAASSRTPPKAFHGWATVRAKELIQERDGDILPVFASPIVDEAPNDNDYHAHVVRPEAWSPSIMALKLRHVFEKYGSVELIVSKAPEAEDLEGVISPPLEDAGDTEREEANGEGPLDKVPADLIPYDAANITPKAPVPVVATGSLTPSTDELFDAHPSEVPRVMQVKEVEGSGSSARPVFCCLAIRWFWQKFFGKS